MWTCWTEWKRTSLSRRRKVNNVFEERFQVYERHGDGAFDLLASNMRIDDAILFIKALFQEAYTEAKLRIEIRRQPKEGDGE